MAKKVLIIEDDAFFRELISKKVTESGFEFMSAVNGEDGVKKVEKDKPDLILLDLLLPNMDGFEVLSRIRQESGSSDTPVIILSNLDRKEDIDKGLKVGANDYLIKSQIDIDEIVEKIKKYI